MFTRHNYTGRNILAGGRSASPARCPRLAPGLPLHVRACATLPRHAAPAPAHNVVDPAPILITGGAGFIGSALVRHLVLERGLAVVNVDALTYAGHRRSVAAAAGSALYAFEHADIADAAQVEAIFRRHRPGAVIHLAAESHVDRSIDGPAPFVHTNVVGTFTLLEQATRHWQGLVGGGRDTFRFVHVSTDEVFGALGAEGRFTASSPYRPNSPYASSKAASDHFARAWLHTYGLPVIVTNCSNNYGPYQYPEKLIPLVIRTALAGKHIPVYGSGLQVRDWLHVTDHVRGLVAAMERGAVGQTYLFGGDAERTNLELAGLLCDLVDELVADRHPVALPRRALIRHVTDRPGHDHRYAIDASQTTESLGWQAQVSLADGLRETVAWYLANADWCGHVEAPRRQQGGAATIPDTRLKPSRTTRSAKGTMRAS
ncbi:MAG: dTDP-glucose 4,6-dehydratase [Gemmatimonadaceae bacterium]|nr:dTDP-glucose 4,6-dehydratase [Gemmatimonadaceae bacterium]